MKIVDDKSNMLSIVVPLYNEEAVIPSLRRRLLDWRMALGKRVECILVNDGSTDGTEGYWMHLHGMKAMLRLCT